jgi:ParB family transcriptional regulator, chromosome partitioning protein
MVDRRLGRGLEFFLSGSEESVSREPFTGEPLSGEEIRSLDLAQVEPGPHQPRREFADKELEELASSIRASGILQPILVRPVAGRFQIVAGERRWRAAKLAGLERIPAVVREIEDQQAAIFSLVENVQRTDLNAIEKARAFREILVLSKGNQAELAKQVGLDRSTVTNFLRLLELPDEVQAMVSRGTITMGHGRALLGLATAEEQSAVADEVARKRLSVRQVEALIQSLNAATDPKAKKSGHIGDKPGRPVWVNEIEETLAGILGVPVGVSYGRKRSRITIECVGREEFERVYELLKRLEKVEGEA